jgi:hypothetical protein
MKFALSKEKLNQKKITVAVSLLKNYVADPNATSVAEAQELLSQVENATSDKLVRHILVTMSDDELTKVKVTGQIDDGKVAHRELVGSRKDLVLRILHNPVSAKEIAEMRLVHRAAKAQLQKEEK